MLRHWRRRRTKRKLERTESLIAAITQRGGLCDEVYMPRFLIEDRVALRLKLDKLR